MIMEIYDITQEVFSSEVYPGDPAPSFHRPWEISKGNLYNLTVFRMCAHNGTHVDAPFHFYEKGKTIDALDLNKCIGKCTVAEFTHQPDIHEMKNVLDKSEKKLLIKGNVVVTLELAKLMNEYGIELIGVESQSVGPVEAPKAVHLELLGKEVVLLEGIRLGQVPEGNYLLFAAPIKLGGSDGAPCRAVLIKM